MTTASPTRSCTDKLHTQVAIQASEFGALLGLSKQQTARAVTDDRLGVPTFQLIERGRHMVSCKEALAYFAERGVAIDPPANA